MADTRKRDRKAWGIEYRQRPEVKVRIVKHRLAASAKRRAIIDTAKSVPCHRCGNIYPPCAMDFHHRDANTKIKRNSREHGFTAIPLHELDAEIAKCDVYCAVCHRIIEFGEES